MNTYYLEYTIEPTVQNEQYELVDSALAHCWALEKTPQAAVAKIAFEILKLDWKIVCLETPPIEVNEEHFAERDLGLEQFRNAQTNGTAIIFLGISKDRKTTAGPIIQKSSYKVDLQEFFDALKKQRNRGRCLHYDAGHRCQKIINAHSIQKGGLLSIIAQNGHVYTLEAQIDELKKNLGMPSYKKKGINKVSTFLGFCEYHDNMLFSPIDDNFLFPTDQQVLLYAYRSIARELFVTHNIFNHLKIWVKKIDHKFIKQFLEKYKTGIEFGLQNLERHKSLFDNSLKEHAYHDVKYVIFISEDKPTIAFSGLIYPDFDFMGRQLQSLVDYDIQLQLITFCSAPMRHGWGYLFAWHKSSSIICNEYMSSLANMIHYGHNVSDFLFRMVILNCENSAISPEWWESLSEKQRQNILSAASSNANPFSPIINSYLSKGLEDISGWSFEKVISNID